MHSNIYLHPNLRCPVCGILAMQENNESGRNQTALDWKTRRWEVWCIFTAPSCRNCHIKLTKSFNDVLNVLVVDIYLQTVQSWKSLFVFTRFYLRSTNYTDDPTSWKFSQKKLLIHKHLFDGKHKAYFRQIFVPQNILSTEDEIILFEGQTNALKFLYQSNNNFSENATCHFHTNSQLFLWLLIG